MDYRNNVPDANELVESSITNRAFKGTVCQGDLGLRITEKGSINVKVEYLQLTSRPH